MDENMNSQRFIKKLFFSILSVMILTFTGCGTQALVKSSSYQAEYLPEEDCPYQSFTWKDNTQFIVATEDGCYYLIGAYLFFMDWDTMQSVPLCFKTDCLHTEETDPLKIPFCDAYMGNTSAYRPFLALYQDKLYTICLDRTTAKSNFVEMNLDGSGRKILYPIYDHNTPYNIFMHRGVIYFVNRMKDLEGESHYGLNALSVVSNSSEPVQVYTGAFEDGIIQDVFPYQNYIFLRDSYDTETSVISKTFMYDIRSGKSEEVIEDHYYIYGIEDDGLLLHHNSGLYYVYSLKDKDLSPSRINDYAFVQEHPYWQCYCENPDENMALFTFLDVGEAKDKREPIADCYIINSQGDVVTTIPNTPWYIRSTQVIERNGEKLYFQYSYDAITIYSQGDLLQGIVNPITIFDASNYSDLLPGILIKTGE